MAKKTSRVNADPLAPAHSADDWQAQGWSRESEPLSAAPRLEATISVRFDPDGASLLRRAAKLMGLTRSEFVRQATLRAARRVVDETPLPAMMWVRDPPTTSIVIQGQEVGTASTSPAPRTRGSSRNVKLAS